MKHAAKKPNKRGRLNNQKEIHYIYYILHKTYYHILILIKFSIHTSKPLDFRQTQLRYFI
jgi:hypothetical protein